MSVTINNIDLDAGCDFFLETVYLDYTTNLPKDITGYTAILAVRDSYMQPNPYLVLTNGNGRIVLGGPSGTIIAHFIPGDTDPSQQATAWTKAVYDLILVDKNGIVTKLMSGRINVIGTVSITSPAITQFLSPVAGSPTTGKVV